MKNQKSFFAGMLTMLLLVCMIGTVSAARSIRQIQVEYKDTKVSLNGNVLDLHDAAGNKVEPFKYGGLDYVPVQALADALDLTVAWDEQTNTIKLSTAKEFWNGYLNAPASVYTTSSKENGMEDIPMYTEGEVTEVSKTNGYNYVVVTTSRGKIAIIDGLKKDGFSSLKKGDTVAAGFVYTGYSDTLKMPSGTYAEVLERKEAPKASTTPENSDKEVKEENTQNSRTVYITKTGKRYHYSSSCNGGTYIASTLSEARARGLTPCNKCVN